MVVTQINSVMNSDAQNGTVCLKMTCKGLSGKLCLNFSVYKERQKRWGW